MIRVSGILTPVITPFADGRLDEGGMKSNVRRLAETPLDGLVVLGSNGEAPQLTEEEGDRAVAAAREAWPSGRPLLAGTGRESTAATIDATRRAAALGADAVLVRTPSFFRAQMTSEALIAHYRAVADAAAVPVLLYNVTMFTGVSLGADAVERLSSHPNIAGMKESGSDIGFLSEVKARTPESFTLLAGSATTLAAALCAGCDGAVLALAAIAPDACRAMLDLVNEGQVVKARALQRRLLPLARLVGTAHGVAGLKAALELLGFAAGPPRQPLLPVSSDTVARIRDELETLGLLPAQVPVAGGRA